MRTKALLLTAALAAAGAASAMAQNVYSVNAVGYVNKSVQHGYSLLANPFVVANESLDALMPTPNDGTVIYKPVSGSFAIRTYDASIPAWDPDGTLTINLGDGVIVYNPSASFNVTFVGEVKQGTPVSNGIGAGITVKSSKVPQAGTLPTLGFVPTANSTVYQYAADGASFIINSFAVIDGFWDPADPNLGMAEAFFIDSAAAQSWDRNFSVN